MKREAKHTESRKQEEGILLSAQKNESVQTLENDWLTRADHWMADHREEMIRELQDLVRIPSVSHPELAGPGEPFGPECRRVLEHMLSRGEAFGFRTKNLDGLAGTISMGDEENAFGIIAHLDVVPVGDGWVYPPFEGIYLPERDLIIGRGGDDNKGPAVASLFLMRMIRDLGISLRHGIRLYCGTSEENGMMDMRRLREAGERFPALSLVPDAGFPVNYGQKGSLKGTIRAGLTGNLLSFRAGSALNVIPDLAECEIAVSPADAVRAAEDLEKELRARLEVTGAENGTRIAAHGISGHAAHPDGSLNAIFLLARALADMDLVTGSGKELIRALRDLSSDNYGISENADFEDEISGKTTLVYSMAELKEGILRVGLDCRFSITHDPEALRGRLSRAWKRAGFVPESLKESSPFYISKEDPRVLSLQRVYQQITGREDPPYTMGGGTYSREVPNAISFGFGMPEARPDLSFLPEGHGGAHGRDEAVPLEKLLTGMKIYLAALLALDETV